MLNPSQLLGNAGAAQGGPGAGGAPPSGGGSGGSAQGAPAGAGAGESSRGGGKGEGNIPPELRSVSSGKGEQGEGEDANKSIGHEDFLKLMTTQLKNQDPTNPKDSDKMMGQIAQLTTASGIDRLQSDFEKFFEHMRSDQSLRAAQLVGREVMTEGDKAQLPEEGELNALLQLERSVPGVTVEVQNQSGETVHREQLGELGQGEHTYTWDGTNDQGERLSPGEYQIKASAGEGDDREAVTTLVGAPVTSVSMGQDGQPPQLNVAGLGELSLSEVQRVR